MEMLHSGMVRFNKVYKSLLLCLAYPFGQLLVSLVMLPVLQQMGVDAMWGRMSSVAFCTILSGLLIIVVAVCLGMLRLRFETGSPAEDASDSLSQYSHRSLHSGLSPLRSVLLLLCSLMSILGLNVLVELTELPDNNVALMYSLAQNPLGVVSLSLVAPLVEELLFRKSMNDDMRRSGLSPLFAVIFSSLLFGVVHMNPIQIPYAFAMGCVLGYVYVRTNNIFLPVAIHVLNNGFAVLLMWLFGVDSSLTGLLGGTYSSVCIALVALLIGILGILKVLPRYKR